MSQQQVTVLSDPTVRATLIRAWEDSQPGDAGAHEEGGFILQDPLGNLSTRSWPKGAQNTITVPAHPNCRIGEKDIIASFHTHPNIGDEYLQEPSETDKRAVRDDPDLKGGLYEGEFVISHEKVYLIAPNGQVREVGDRMKILDIERDHL
jgi:hypothetical protein